ncbi:MAG: Uma2 family endonuclease [Dehalococcoidia bacterium]
MTTTVQLGLDQFLVQPETEPASEYACGEVNQKPMPTNAHAILQTYLAVLLFQFLVRTGLGGVRTEWRCIFGPAGRERAVVPDLVVVSKERLPKGDARDTPYLRAAPDLAIEILSPGQPTRPFVDKITFFLRHGVRLVWIVDPLTESVLVLSPGEDNLTLTIDDQLDGNDVLPGFSVAVRDLFAQLQG